VLEVIVSLMYFRSTYNLKSKRETMNTHINSPVEPYINVQSKNHEFIDTIHTIAFSQNQKNGSKKGSHSFIFNEEMVPAFFLMHQYISPRGTINMFEVIVSIMDFRSTYNLKSKRETINTNIDSPEESWINA
jgi:hypothetical protein